MDRIDAMHLFVRVANAGSFSAVAQQMNVARSVVTRQIAALESHLRVKLLARSTRHLSLTSAGAAYLEKCREILALVESAETDLGGEHQTPRGTIRLSVPLSFGLRHLSPLLLEFAKTYPEVTLDVDYTDRRSKLFEEGIDLAVRITDRLDTSDIARRISTSRLAVVASEDYLARHGEPRHPSELVNHHCLGYTAAPTPSQWPFIVDGRAHAFPIRSRLQTNNGDVLLQAAIAGFGLTRAPMFIAAEALRSGQVRQVLNDFPIAELGIYAVLPSNRLVPHRIRILMDFLAHHLGPIPEWEK
ncbi:LysR family transcriptional regulator [Propionivibrio limicola]|uniref:LysR family transcriptional regulator n=1 Tax=Propionivibrio limicola TaxID=167645 RepID=UPI0012915EB8|nr:LysR family transcriptional regulator [Propionivibrio limicola]